MDYFIKQGDCGSRLVAWPTFFGKRVYEDSMKYRIYMIYLVDGRLKGGIMLWLTFALGIFTGVVCTIFSILWWVYCCD